MTEGTALSLSITIALMVAICVQQCFIEHLHRRIRALEERRNRTGEGWS